MRTDSLQQQSAQKVLTQFQEHPDAWQRVPKILSESNNSQTKFIALQVNNANLRTCRYMLNYVEN